MRIISNFLLVVLFLFLGCQKNPAPMPQYRVGNFLLSAKNVRITLFFNNKKIQSTNISYGQLSTYSNIKPNKYLIEVKVNDQVILKKNVGFGRGIYTLILAGIPEKDQEVNRESLNSKLHNIVEGAEAMTENSFYPQLLIQNGFFVAESGMAKISVTNLMPGSKAFHVQFKNKDHEMNYKSIAYPTTTKVKPIPSGNYQFLINLRGRTPIPLDSSFSLKEKTLYSYFIIPRENSYITKPKIVVGITKKRK